MLPLQTGTIVNGRYRLLRHVGGVDEAERWIGEDTTLRREVDLWIIAADHPRAAAVQDAARRAAVVEDPRLPRILDIGVEDGVQWVISQHDHRSRTLVELVEDAPLSAGEARRMVGEAAQALDAAGRQGVHHGALTPEMLQRDADGGVLLKGLGVAAALAGHDLVDTAQATARDTRGLVALLYTALTGEWPGDGRTLARHADREAGLARPSDVVKAVPHDLDELCAQLDVEGPLELHGQAVDTPGEMVRVLAPWEGSTVAGTGRLRTIGSTGAAAGAAGVAGAGGAAGALTADGVTQVVPTASVAASEAPTTSIPTVPGEDLPTAALATPAQGAAADGPSTSASVAAAGSAGAATAAPSGTGSAASAAATDPGVAGAAGAGADGARAHDGAATTESAARESTAAQADSPIDGSTMRKPLLLAGAGSLALAGALALAVWALPDLFGGDDDPASQTAAPPASSAPQASEGATEQGSDDETGEDQPGSSPEQNVSSAPEGQDDATDGEQPDESTGGTSGDAPGGAPGADGTTDGGTDADDAPSDDAQDQQDRDQQDQGSQGEGSPDDPQGGESPESSTGAETSGPEGSTAPESPAETSQTPSADTPAETDSPQDEDDASADAPAAALPIRAIEAYDPHHDGDEHQDWTNRINNPSTELTWSTHKYKHRPFGGYTDGLGLRVDLGEVREVSAVDLGMPVADTALDVRVGPSEDISRAVTLGSHRGGGQVTITGDEPVQGRYVFIWFTDTAPIGGGWYRADLKDVTVH